MFIIVDMYHLIADVWVAGDSYISKLEKRAKTRHIHSSLGAQNVKWIEQPGLNWLQLQPEIQFQAIHSIPPRAIVIHVGSNDLVQVKGVVIILSMKADLQHLVNNTLNTKITSFSATFPRTVLTKTKIQKNGI